MKRREFLKGALSVTFLAGTPSLARACESIAPGLGPFDQATVQFCARFSPDGPLEVLAKHSLGKFDMEDPWRQTDWLKFEATESVTIYDVTVRTVIGDIVHDRPAMRPNYPPLRLAADDTVTLEVTTVVA